MFQYRCFGSVLFDNSDPSVAAWISRDGMPQIYWGGATSHRDRYCACGETSKIFDHFIFYQKVTSKLNNFDNQHHYC